MKNNLTQNFPELKNLLLDTQIYVLGKKEQKTSPTPATFELYAVIKCKSFEQKVKISDILRPTYKLQINLRKHSNLLTKAIRQHLFSNVFSRNGKKLTFNDSDQIMIRPTANCHSFKISNRKANDKEWSFLTLYNIPNDFNFDNTNNFQFLFSSIKLDQQTTAQK